jgi:hypothetical protein
LSRLFWLVALAALGIALVAHSGLAADDEQPTIVLTQLPRDPAMEQGEPVAGGMLRASYGNGGRIILLEPGSGEQVLTEGFHSACDPDISFDGRRMLFAGKKQATDDWNIYEMELDGSGVRRITRAMGNCRSPVYQGTFYTIDATQPWKLITFVSDAAGEENEFGAVPATSLYSCRLDGSEVRRLTYNPSSDMDPVLLPDGRVLFSSWQRGTLDYGLRGRISLFASQTDGLDYTIFSGDEGQRIKHMPCVTPDRQVVFVEGERVGWDGAGTLAAVLLRRNLRS